MANHRATGPRTPVPRALRHAGGGHRAAVGGFGWGSFGVLVFVLATAGAALLSALTLLG